MKTQFAIFFACLALIGCQPAEEPGPPNIILIVADDMGLTDIGPFGSEIATPNLDRLAYEGVRLTNFHASATCAPTRSMLLSGADNHTAGVGSMFGANFIEGGFGDRPGYEHYLHPRVATLPERLGDAGYHTYMAGKWHLGAADDQEPSMRGFESSFALMLGSASHMGLRALNMPTYRENGVIQMTLPEDFYSTDFYTGKMIDYIGANHGDGQPFFGYLALTSPHWPLQAPPEFIDRYAGRYDDGYDALRMERVNRAVEMGIVPDVDSELFDLVGPSWDELTEEEQRYSARKMEIYAAMVENMDYNVGRLVSYLDEIGELDNTFIFFMSDNGAEGDREDMNPTFSRGVERGGWDNSYENLGKATSWVHVGPGWAQAGMAPFRLYKGFLTEGGTLVAALAYHPRLTSESLISDQYLTVMDVMPTFLDIAGAEFDETTIRGRPVEPMIGKSFRELLHGSTEPVHPAEEVIATELHGQRALMRGDWKIVWEQAAPNSYWGDDEPAHWGRWRLHNLESDPTEQHDLSESMPAVFEELVGLWHAWAAENNVKESVTPFWPEPRP
jgi:arylsulfatase